MGIPPEVAELVASLLRRIEALEAENAELQRRLDLDRPNSSKPPSSDGLKKKPRILRSLRERTGKRSGARKATAAIRCVKSPSPTDCRARSRAMRALPGGAFGGLEDRRGQAPGFRSSGEAADRDRTPRAVHDCPACGRRTRADFPEGVVCRPSTPALKAAAVYSTPSSSCPKSEPRRSWMTCSGQRRPAARAWPTGFAVRPKRWRRSIAASANASPRRRALPRRNGLRVAGTTRWLHTASTPTHTFYRADEPRSAVPELQGGVVVDDHWRPTTASTMSITPFATPISCANFRRSANSTRSRADALRATLLDANAAVRTAKAQGAPAIAPETIKAFEDRYWAAVRDGLALHRSLPAFDPATTRKSGRSSGPPTISIRFKTFKEATLRFLTDFTVPFTNNLAEQDLRMMKVKTKISGGFRTPERRRLRLPALRDLVGPKAAPPPPQSPDPHPRMNTGRRLEALSRKLPFASIQRRTPSARRPEVDRG